MKVLQAILSGIRNRKKFDTDISPEDYIGNVAKTNKNKMENWIINNPPKFKKGDRVHVEYFYGGDYWGAFNESDPDGAFTVVGVVKMRLRHGRENYFWEYVLVNKKGEYEITGESRYPCNIGIVTNGVTITRLKPIK